MNENPILEQLKRETRTVRGVVMDLSNKKKIQKKYKKVLSDGTECEFVFSILKPETEGCPEEILHIFAELSKSAYIQLGNKMVYGSGNQKEIEKLVANKCNQPAD